MKEYICKECNKTFEAYPPSNRKFCSPSCCSKYNNKKRRGYRNIELTCNYCKKPFIIRKGELSKKKKDGFKFFYCSRDCSSKDKKNKKRPNTSKSLIKAYAEGRAKPQKYKTKGGFKEDLGIMVRSNWEANYARILNLQKKRWKYEPKYFLLTVDGIKTTYTPDFYIEDEDKWVEIKGFWYTQLQKRKFEIFSQNHNTELIGVDAYLKLKEEYQDRVYWEEKADKTFLIGEIGLNANGDVNIAKKLIDLMVKYKWNAVKFQKRTVEEVIPKSMWHIKKETPWGLIDYIDYKKRLEFGKEEYDEIDSYCKKKGIRWFASAWDLKSQRFLDRYNLKYNKIASAMITYAPLLKHVAKQKKLTFVSTGMATDEQIDYAINIFVKYDCPVVLMHCVGTYPCPLERLNLNRIKVLRRRFDVPVGYSGHSEGAMDAVLACGIGAEYIEKHITLNRSMFGSDQSASIEPSGMEFISKHIHNIPIMLGDGRKHFYEEEIENAKKLRYWGHGNR